MKTYRKLSDQDQEALEDWWEALELNRAERAQLRRASSADDVLLSPAFVEFLRQMPAWWGVAPGEKGIGLVDAALVAMVLSRVKTDERKYSFAGSLARPAKKGASKAAMSEMRFQQLQKSRTEQEFLTRMCRAVDLLRGSADILSVADSILHWLHEFRFAPATRPQDRLAVKWATDYYAVPSK